MWPYQEKVAKSVSGKESGWRLTTCYCLFWVSHLQHSYLKCGKTKSMLEKTYDTDSIDYCSAKGPGSCCVYCTHLQSILTHCMDGSPVGHETKGVLEYATCMEERQGDTHDALQPLLCPSKPGSAFVFHLIKQFIFSKREDWHQMSTEKKEWYTGQIISLIVLLSTSVYRSITELIS